MDKRYIHAYAHKGEDEADSCGPVDIAADDDLTLLAWIRDQLDQGRIIEIWGGCKDG